MAATYCEKMSHNILCLCAGDMVIYAGGQQPFQRVNVGTNFLQAKFTIAAA